MATDGQHPDDLPAWIADLRVRLGRGDLVTLPPFDLGDGAMPTGERGVRVMLADLDHLTWLAWYRPDVDDLLDRRRHLLGDFRRLRDLIG